MHTARALTAALRRRAAFQAATTALLLLLRILVFGLPLLALYVYADAILALPAVPRRTWNLLLPALTLGLALFGLPLPDFPAALALKLDRHRRDKRRTLSCALDLATQPPNPEPLHSAMRDQAVREGLDVLRATPARACLPGKQILLFASAALLMGLTFWSLAQQHRDIIEIVRARILAPGEDIAPWTPLKFEFLPDAPEVVYGGDIQVGVRIHNGTPDRPVMLRTRIDGVEREAGCFREPDNVFSQRLEQVTRPVEYRFAIGRVVSPWRTVDVQTLPRVTAARVQLIPPEYSGFSDRAFAFGERGIEALTGSELRLAVQSNRPLEGGEVTLTPSTGTRRVRANIRPEGWAEFRWTLEESAEISVQVRDVRGQQLAAPLAGSQRALADQSPLAVITHPPRFALATPDTQLNIEGHGSDDIGVTRLTLVRGMSGFIDRPARLWEGEPVRRRTVETEMDLSALGAEPGQELELYLEARDHRPERPGIGVSEMVRVQIITPEEYAEHLRTREQLEGFRRRFALRAAVLREVAEAYQTLHERLAGDPDIDEVDAALAEAAEVLRRAERAFAALEEDFPIFDLEQSAAPGVAQLREHFTNQAEQMEALSHREPNLDLLIEQMGAAFIEQRDTYAQSQEEQEDFLKLGALMEQTTAFQRLIQRQERLEREFARYAFSLPAEERDILRRLHEMQNALLEDLQRWISSTRERAGDLPDHLQALREEVEEMLQGLDASNAAEYMRGAADSALNEAHRQAWQFSRAALDALRNPPPDDDDSDGSGGGGDNNFGQLCRGGGNRPGAGSTPLNNSLDQLLRALRHGLGDRPGGGGGGPGGFSDDGYSVSGSSALSVPLLGPNRMNLDLPRGGEADGQAFGTGVGGAQRIREIRGSEVETESEDMSAGEIRIHLAPPRYRDAIRRFFDF